jgi:hypothetical protein
MAQQVTVSEAVASLQSMFPSYEEDVLRALLAANNNQIEHTIEQVLTMEGDSPGSGPSASAERHKPGSEAPQHQTEDLLSLGTEDKQVNQDINVGVPEKGVSPVEVSVRKAADPSMERRGTKVTLPEDFLRAPGWRENNPTLGDEQLAIMLQNEMFQRQVAASMGENFLESMRGGNRSNASRNTGGSAAGGKDSSGVSRAGTSNSSGTVPDMGILKSLSSMSEGARRNLNALAAQFDNKKTATRASTRVPPAETGIDRYEDASPRSNDRRGLLAQNDDEDDDEEEIVFNSNPGRSQHALDDRDEL